MTATDETHTQTDVTARRTSDVRLVRVTKTFGDTLAVDDISLTIEDGQFFSLLGPSGCGKTTTLSMIGGFEDPTAGAIYLGGVEVSSQPAYRRDVNTVFQSYALFPHLDVFENVAFGLRRRRVAKDEIKSRVEDILGLVDLPGYERRKPGQLSGGQQQRVALARALVNRPKLLLLDEPLGALDLKLRKQMQLELKRIQTEVGITFLYVTHDQEEAMVMSDRLAVMSGGRIEQIGPPEDVYDRPATKFVAGFLGASNLIAGDVVGREAGEAVVKLENGDTVRLPADRLSPHSRSVMIGVRPEKISVGAPDAAAPDGWAGFEGTIAMTAYIGVSHQYTVNGPGDRAFTVYTQNVGADGGPRQGDRIQLMWDLRHTFVVEADGSPVETTQGGTE
ncbi:MAG TPA: ABC transporter ATP-binding protein [Gaiellales bacterium]|nr:ABC transporter ATP-binding protein [Gaiellales bacterium]